MIETYINTLCGLWLLDEIAISTHAADLVILGELARDQSVRVQTGQGDELPAVAELTETLDVCLLVLGSHGRLPVERR